MAVLAAVFILALATHGVIAHVSQQVQREREAQLLRAGQAYADAIRHYYEQSPGSLKRWPAQLQDLVDDRRSVVIRRHIRKLYPDPVARSPDWGLILAADAASPVFTAGAMPCPSAPQPSTSATCSCHRPAVMRIGSLPTSRPRHRPRRASADMPLYKVRSLARGAPDVTEQMMEAEDEQALAATLTAQGAMVLGIRRRHKLTLKSPLRRGRFPIFCREVRTLIQAGMTIVEAADTLSARERAEGSGTTSLAAAVLGQLEKGQSLSTALEGISDCPQVLIAAVRAGERTSNLSEALDDYLRFDSLIEQLRRKAVSAAIYPALVTALGFAISLFLMMVVMPNFARMYENLRGSASGTTALMIQMSRFMSENRPTLFAGLIVSMACIAWWIRSGTAARWAIDLGQATPWIRRRIEDFQLAMMYQALTLLLKGGYPMVEAIDVAGRSALSSRLAEALTRARLRIESGGMVSKALSEAQLCDEVGRRLMAAAERNGNFHKAADVVSRIHCDRFELFVERMTRIIEPVLLLGVALIVGGIVVMMYLPVFDMATRLR